VDLVVLTESQEPGDYMVVEAVEAALPVNLTAKAAPAVKVQFVLFGVAQDTIPHLTPKTINNKE
jgi:hypothetical protein